MIFHRLGLILNREARRGYAPSKTSLPPRLGKEKGIQGVRLIHKNQKGFTLVELIIAIAISGAIAGVIIMTIFQVIDGSARSSNHMTAIEQVQSAGYWVSHDTQMAQSVVADNLTPPEILELTWTDWDGDEHTVIYSLEDMASSGLKNLQQSHAINGNPPETTFVAQYIDPDQAMTSCSFNVTGGELTFTVTATVGTGSQTGSETRVYEILPRPGS